MTTKKKNGGSRYSELTKKGQNRAKQLGYAGMIYTPTGQADIDRAHKMIMEGGGVGLVGAGMLVNFQALRVAEEEQEANVLDKIKRVV
jgi:hypothetical protein